MRHSTFGALAMAGLLFACASDQSKQRSENAAEANQRSAHARAERASGDERVDVPKHRGEHGRVAEAPKRTHEEARSDATNTGEHKELSALDQGNGEIDLDLTQRIRKAVMDDDSLSFTAKNAKIITKDGHVTLRGSVNSAAEKESLYKCAVDVAGVGHVSNELEIDND